MLPEIKTDARTRMNKSLESLRHELAKIRTGRAHPSLLEHVHVDYYGSDVPISQAASVAVEDARANFLEHETGSIEVGKKADMVVLEKNLFDIPVTDIADTKVMMTLFEGKTVYRDDAL